MLDKHRGILIDLLIQHQPRWRSISLIVTGHLLWDTLQRGLSSNWASLQELFLSTWRLRRGSEREGIRVLQGLTSIESMPLQKLTLFLTTKTEVTTTAGLSFLSAYTSLRTLVLTLRCCIY